MNRQPKIIISLKKASDMKDIDQNNQTINRKKKSLAWRRVGE